MFILKNVLPIPIKDQIQESQIWDTDCVLEVGLAYFVVAPSGKGKTTLQHLLYGLRNDYTGEIRLADSTYKGKVLNKLNSTEWADLRQVAMSVIFQDLRLFPEMTALENIQLKNQLTGFKTTGEIQEMAKALGVETLLDKPCNQLSFGQRQRIAIIRSLCQPFKILLMDEPFAHLDKENIRKACTLIQAECRSQNASLLIASLGDRYDFEYDCELTL